MFQTLLPMNESAVERAVRIAIGIALLALTVGGTLSAWGYLGIVPLLTGIVGSCPIYTLFGISTCPYNPARKTT
jgi:DUF2892 family protein